MNMLVTPAAVRLASLTCEKIEKAINVQNGLFDTLKILAPKKYTQGKSTFFEKVSDTIFLSQKERQEREALFLRAHEPLANHRRILEHIREYATGEKEKPSLEVQEAMYRCWNGECQKSEKIEFHQAGQEVEVQEELTNLENANLGYKQNIQRPQLTPETMGLVEKVKKAHENAVAQANKPKSDVEKALTSSIVVGTTMSVIGGMTALTQHFIAIGLIASTPFLVFGIPIIAVITTLSLTLSVAYVSLRYNARTEYARKLNAEFFITFIESLNAMLSEILGNTRTILGLQSNTIRLQNETITKQNEVKQDMRTGVAALNQVQANTEALRKSHVRFATTVEDFQEEIRESMREGFDGVQAGFQAGVRALQGLREEPRQVINYITIDAGSLSSEQQRRLQGQASASEIGYEMPSIMLSQEGRESVEMLLEHQPGRQRQDSGGSLPGLSSAGSSPASSSSSSFEGADRSLARYRAPPSFKGKERAEPPIFEEHNIDALLSSDSESDSDTVLTVEEKEQLKQTRAHRKAERKAKIEAFIDAKVKVQVEANNAQMQEKINKQTAILNALGVNVN